MNLSSFCFGILFLLKASFAQSAPHSYPDEDEEALIDKLAAFAAVAGRDTLPLSKQLLPPNYDIPQLNYFNPVDSALNEEAIARDALLKLPRQFGYKPNDIRFHLPADLFSKYTVPVEEDLQRQLEPVNDLRTLNSFKNVGNQVNNDLNANSLPQLEEQQQRRLPLSVNNKPMMESSQTSGQNAYHEAAGQKIPEIHDADFYFMKKKEHVDDSRGPPVRSYVPGPSNIMASADHSASYPGFSSSQITEKPFTYADMYYIAIVAGCSAAAVVGIIAAGVCWYRIHERIKAAADVDYPAYGVTGPSKDITPSGGDRKLAQSAQMYHYQHQKQQMAALQKGSIQGDRQGSDVESDDDNEDGDYTVYECPGLAPAGEMEVKNPLFQDEPTPASKGSEESSQAAETPAKSTDTESTTKPSAPAAAATPAPDAAASKEEK